MLVTKPQENGDTSRFGVLRGGTGDTGELRGGTCDTEEGIFIRPMKAVRNTAALSTTAIPFAVWFGMQNLNKHAGQLVAEAKVLNHVLNDKAGQLVAEAKALNHGLNDKAGHLVAEASALNHGLNNKAGQLVWTFQVVGVLGLLLGYSFLFKSIKW
jgi:hypothetical protein